MAVNLGFNFLGVIVFMFLFWQRLKEDYLSSQIFSSSLIIVFSVFLFCFASRLYFPVWWFWFSALGFLAGLGISIVRFGLRLYETLEAALVSALPWTALVFLTDSIRNANLTSLIGFFISMGVIPLYLFLNARYKDFSWYKSGRVGFAGLTAFGIYFLLRGVVSIFFPFVISFVRDYEPIVSGMVAFTFFLLVFNLSRKSI